MYDVFGKFGSIRQIRKGKTADKKGTAFIVYEDIYSNVMDGASTHSGQFSLLHPSASETTGN